MATLTVSLPDDVMGWINERIGEGGFASADEYLSELVRQDQGRLDELRRIVDEGLAGGVSERTFSDRIADGDRISNRTTAEIFAEAVEIAKSRGTYRE
jgi:antitoxin ParD1/3/4